MIRHLAVAAVLVAMPALAGEDQPLIFRVNGETLSAGSDRLDEVSVRSDLSGRPAVLFRFDQQLARDFTDLTGRNVGRVMVVELCGQTVTESIIHSAIFGGVVLLSVAPSLSAEAVAAILSDEAGCATIAGEA